MLRDNKVLSTFHASEEQRANEAFKLTNRTTKDLYSFSHSRKLSPMSTLAATPKPDFYALPDVGKENFNRTFTALKERPNDLEVDNVGVTKLNTD